MDAIRTWTSRIMGGALVARGGKQAAVRAALGMLLVLGLAACGGESGYLYEVERTTAAAYTRAPATTYDAAASAVALSGPSPDRPSATTTMIQAAAATTMAYAPADRAAEEQAAMAAAEEQAAMAALEVAEVQLAPPPPSQPSATNFQDYVQSRFVPTAEDNVSTFSLDTDRTSFQLALNWARYGYEVDPDSVRAEEWINAFDYGYEYPIHADSFAVSTDVVRHPLDSGKHLVRIGFQAPDLVDDRPLNVTLVLDASGSMSDGNRVDIAREAAEAIRRSLRPQDRIAVVHFTTDVIHDYTVDHRSPDDEWVRRSIERLAPHDSTNVQAGLNLGVRLADRARIERPDAYNYIILMSDGVANVDATDPFAILETARDPDSGNPLRLIMIGVGISNYNDYLLEQLAQYGNGWYRYLNDIPQARATFSRGSWLALSIPFADQTRAQVTWNDRVVESWRMIGYENRITSDESFTQDRKEFAEIPVGAATTVFYELRLRDAVQRQPAGTVDLGDVNLRWVSPMSGLSNRQSADLISGLDAEMYDAEALMQFGAVVALSSDRYSSLPYVDADDGRVGAEMRALSDWLRPLGRHLGDRSSYQDFSFLLDHLTAGLPVEASTGSGYSR